MAERFNLTAQLHLQAPTNTGAVITQIRRQLKGVEVDVKVKSNVATLSKTSKELQRIDKSARSSAKSMGQLNRTLSDAARRFSVITVATGTMLTLARAFKNSVGEAIAFERELVRISQVTGKSVKNLQDLTQEVTRLSTSLGASSKDLLNVSRVLAQAGFSATQTRKALDILAKTSLGATFSSIQDTTEGAIAVLRQFRKEAQAAGGDIKFLEQTLDAINSVSKKFAVESGDLITVIRRVGGVFESAGGNVNELIALFTSVRATTRESAETIATGLRTIFTRLQRTDTIDQLKALGIQLQDASGQFVGAYEAVRRLSVGLSGLDPRDYRFSEIVEQLGGFRQIGKVIPLIRQFTTAQQALNVAQAASGSVTKDAVIAQQALSVQFARVREDFDALIRKFTDSSTFRAVAGGALELARAFIKVAESLEPMLPLITSLIALKIGRSLAPGLGALAGIGGGTRGRATGGRIHKFARGGFVPGTGSRDTVPAMLQPGEFVIRKSSAAKLGSATLSAMNQNRYNKGKKVKDTAKFTDFKEGKGEYVTNAKAKGAIGSVLRNMGDKDGDSEFDFGGAFLRPVGVAKKAQAKIPGANILKAVQEKMGGSKTSGAAIKRIMGVSDKFNVPMMLYSGSIPHKSRRGFSSGLRNKIGEASKTFVSGLGGGIQYNDKRFRSAYNKANKTQIEGNVFEAAVASGNSAQFNEKRTLANATFDFPKGISGKLSSLLNIKEGIPVDAKRSFNEESVNSLVKKGFTQFVETASKNAAMKQIFIGGEKDALFDKKKLAQTAGVSEEEETAARKGKLIGPRRIGRAMGGKIDSVPALLTPGEFVVKKSAAQSIGYGNLNKMNQTGVQRFATGGIVQRFAEGGEVPEKGGTIDTASFKADSKASKFLGQALVEYGESAISARKIVQNFEAAVEQGVAPTQALADVLDAAESSVNAQDVASKAYTKSLKEKADSPALEGRDEIVRAQIAEEEQGVAERAKARPDQEGINNKKRQRQAALIGGAEARFESDPKASVKEQKANAAALKAYTKAIKKGRSHVAALNSAKTAATKAEKEYTKAVKEAAAKAKKERQAQGEAQGKAIGQKQQKIQAQQGQAQAAQSMIMLAGTVGAVVSQMGIFDDAMGDAVSAALAMGSTMMGLGGTVLEMVNSMRLAKLATAASTASELAETGANAANTKSEIVETAANVASAKSEGLKGLKGAGGGGKGMMSKLGGTLKSMGPAMGALIAVAVAAAIIQGFSSYFSGKQKEEREKGDAEAKRIREKGGAGGAQTLIKARQGAVNREAQGSHATGGALSGAAVGMAVGAFLGPVGMIVGAGLGAIIGGIAGSFWQATDGVVAASKKLAEAEFTAAAAMYDFDKDMKDINLKQLKGTDRFMAVSKALNKAAAKGTEARQKQRSGEVQMGKETAQADWWNLGSLGMMGRAAGELTEEQQIQVDTGRKGIEDQKKQVREQALPAFLTEMQAQAQRWVKEGKTAEEIQKLLNEKQNRYVQITGDNVAEGESSAEAEARARSQMDALNESTAQAAAQTQATNDVRERERKAILRTAAALAKLDAVDNAIARFSVGLSSATSVLQGNFQATGRQEKIGDITNVGNFDDFNKQVDSMAAKFGPAGKEMASEIKNTAANIGGLQKNLKVEKLGKIDSKAGEEEIEKALGEAGIKLTGTMRKDVIARITALGGNISQVDLDKIVDDMAAAQKKNVDVLNRGAATLNKAIGAYDSAMKALIDQKNREIGATQAIVEQQEKSKDLIAQAQGTTRPRAAKEAARTQKAQTALRGTGVAAGDVAGLKARAMAAKSAMKLANDLDKAGKSTDRTIVAGNNAADQYSSTTNELKRLADQSARSADVMSDLEKATAKRQAVEETVKDFTFATNEGRQEMVQQFGALERVLQTGSLDSIPDDMRGAVGGLLDKFADIELAPGVTGADVSKQLQVQELDKIIRMQSGGEKGISQQQIDQIFSATSEEQKLTNELRSIANQEAAATKALQQIEQQNTALLQQVLQQLLTNLRTEVKKNADGLAVTPEDQTRNVPVNPAARPPITPQQEEKNRRQAAAAGTPVGSAPAASNAAAVQQNLAVIEQATGGEGAEAAATNALQQIEMKNGVLLQQVLQQLSAYLTKDQTAQDNQTVAMHTPSEGLFTHRGAANQMRTGGVVYAAGGASIFKPRGTDTVPAMLTPGEFVIRKSAVDEIGVDTLSALNRGGQVAYRAAGGPINMLSPDLVTSLYFSGLKKSGTRGVKNAYKQADVDPNRTFKDTTLIRAVMGGKHNSTLAQYGFDPAAKFLIQMVEVLNSNSGLFGLAGSGSVKIADEANTDAVKTFQSMLMGLTAKMPKGSASLLAFSVPQFFSQLDALYTAINQFWNFKSNPRLGNETTNVGKAPAGKGTSRILKNAEEMLANQKLAKFQIDPETGMPIDDLKGRNKVKMTQTVGFAAGGHVDSVPAMLTPGEFIMSKGAVQRHGVGFMKNLNQGRIPGFRRGGVVGTGNVQYKQGGGSVGGGGVLSLDPTRLQGVLDNFNAQFSASLDNVVGVFSGFGDSLQQLVASFNGITMTHNVQVEGLISLGGLNVEAIKEELSTAIGTMVADQVSQTMDRQAKEFKSSG